MNSPSETSIASRIADALGRLATLARANEQAEAHASGLSPLQARVLATLSRRGPLRVGALAEESMVSYGTVSAAISSLEEKGLVDKTPDPDEHRAVHVALTRRGRTAARRADGWATEQLEPAVADLGGDSGGRLLASLLGLLRAFERRGDIARARMCLTCHHFRPWKGKGKKPHYCGLLERPIGDAQLQIDCPDHDAAAPSRTEEVWRRLTSGR